MITIYTTDTCSDCVVTKLHLDRLGLEYEEVNITADEAAADFVMSVNDGRRSVPTLVVNGQATSLSRFTRGKFDDFMQRHGLAEASPT